MLNNYLDQLQQALDNPPPPAEWKEWGEHPVTLWFRDFLESEYANLANAHPRNELGLVERGSWTVARDMTMNALVIISDKMDGPEEDDLEEGKDNE